MSLAAKRLAGERTAYGWQATDLILHERVRYEEPGPAVSVEAKKVRARKMIRELRSLGYRVVRGTLFDGLSDFRPWLIRAA